MLCAHVCVGVAGEASARHVSMLAGWMVDHPMPSPESQSPTEPQPGGATGRGYVNFDLLSSVNIAR
jgi:hypothetical protein